MKQTAIRVEVNRGSYTMVKFLKEQKMDGRDLELDEWRAASRQLCE